MVLGAFWFVVRWNGSNFEQRRQEKEEENGAEDLENDEELWKKKNAVDAAVPGEEHADEKRHESKPRVAKTREPETKGDAKEHGNDAHARSEYAERFGEAVQCRNVFGEIVGLHRCDKRGKKPRQPHDYSGDYFRHTLNQLAAAQARSKRKSRS